MPFLEEKFNGTAPNIDTFWPPTMPSDEYGHDPDHIVSESEYKTIIKNNPKLWKRPDLASDSPENLKIDEIKVDLSAHVYDKFDSKNVLKVGRTHGLAKLDKGTSNHKLLKVRIYHNLINFL